MKRLVLFIFAAAIFVSGCNFNNEDDGNPVDPGNDDLSGTIKNNDFEISIDGKLPEHWLTRIVGSPQFDFFSLDNSIIKSGAKSLRIKYVDSLANPSPTSGSWGGIYQTIFINNIKPGIRYILNFWIKSETGNFQIRLAKNGDLNTPLLSYIISTPTDWVEQNIAFTIDSDTNYLELWINTKDTFAKNGSVIGWIDNIRVTK